MAGPTAPSRMRVSTGIVALSLAVFMASATPIVPKKRFPAVTSPPLTDDLLLNFVLKMQVNENTYYSTALDLYNASDFVAAGVPSWVRGRIEQILEHEQAHVDKLREMLGPNAQESTCVFEWPYDDPFSFIVLSQILEGLNAGTLIKMLPLIQNKALVPVISNLIATESRHAWIGSAGGKLMPWSGPWETPATFGQYTTQLGVHTISCPTDNYVLPFQQFQWLMSVPYCHGCVLTPDTPLQLNFTTNPGLPPPYYAAFMVGLNTTFVPIVPGNLSALPPDYDPVTSGVFTGVTHIPPFVQGDVYIMAVNSNDSVTDDNSLAGAFLFQAPFPGDAKNNNL